MGREQGLQQLADLITAVARPHTLRVAIDGIDAAGKTTLADELKPLIEARGRPIIRASIDGFHRPRSQRYRRGALSPEGYYEDSFDYTLLQTVLLAPLGPQGNLRYQRAAFDFRTDTPLASAEEIAPSNGILLFDGIFLLRPELVQQWDYRVLVSVTSETAIQRALLRDLSLFGATEAIQERYTQRYFPAQLMYQQIACPQEQADVIVDNNDPDNLLMTRIQGIPCH